MQVVKVANSLEDQGTYKSQKSQALGGTKGLTSRKVESPWGDQGAYKSQAFWGTKGLTSRKMRKPFAGPRRLQVANPLWDQGAYMSQAL